MGAEKRCPNCGNVLSFIKRENVQLGKTGWFLGDWPNLLAGALDTEIWGCHACGKLEFYMGGFQKDEAEEVREMQCETDFTDHMAQVICPACGYTHDMDDPKCPYCGAKNPSI